MTSLGDHYSVHHNKYSLLNFNSYLYCATSEIWKKTSQPSQNYKLKSGAGVKAAGSVVLDARPLQGHSLMLSATHSSTDDWARYVQLCAKCREGYRGLLGTVSTHKEMICKQVLPRTGRI